MRHLPLHELYECNLAEAGVIIAYLRRQGYRWIQEEKHKHFNLYDTSGEVCVGEFLNNHLYLDGRVESHLTALLSGGASGGAHGP